MPLLTSKSYLDFDVSLVGRNTYDTTTLPSNQVKIKASVPGADDNFGYSVAVGSNRIVVGAPYDTVSLTTQGSAFIFDLNGSPITRILASDPVAGSAFGYSVAVGSNRVVAGAPFNNQGAAYIFNLNGTQIAKITASDAAAGDDFGHSVAVGCGRIVVGAPNDDDNGSNSGSAYIFDLYGNQLAKIKPLVGVAGDVFGRSVAIGSGRIVVGVPLDDDNGTSAGAVYIFDLNGNQLAKIKPTVGNPSDFFGRSVAVGSGRIVVGSPFDDDKGSSAGAVYIFDLNGNQLAKIKASDGDANDSFGYSVAVGSGRIFVGAERDEDNGTDSGSAYIFDLNGNELAKIEPSDPGASEYFGTSVAVGFGRIVVGAAYDDDNSLLNSGSAYIFTTPNQTHTLDLLD